MCYNMSKPSILLSLESKRQICTVYPQGRIEGHNIPQTRYLTILLFLDTDWNSPPPGTSTDRPGCLCTCLMTCGLSGSTLRTQTSPPSHWILGLAGPEKQEFVSIIENGLLGLLETTVMSAKRRGGKGSYGNGGTICRDCETWSH